MLNNGHMGLCSFVWFMWIEYSCKTHQSYTGNLKLGLLHCVDGL